MMQEFLPALHHKMIKFPMGIYRQTKTEQLHGVDVPLYIIGDAAYPLQLWLMKPFPHNGALSQEEQRFNFVISSARIVVENAYGRLKGRWRRLMKRNDVHIDNIPTIIVFCTIYVKLEVNTLMITGLRMKGPTLSNHLQ